LTRVDPCVDDPNHYIVGTNDSWIESMHNGIHVHMVYTYEDGILSLHHPSLSELQLGLTSSTILQEMVSLASIRPRYYIGSSLDVTPLLRDRCFVKIDRKKSIHLDGLVIPTTNSVDLIIKSSHCPHSL
jgi:hypothetical protein